jgi:hypothetical protein
MRWVRLTNFFMVSKYAIWRMWLALFTSWQGQKKIPACTWGRVLRNNFILPINKTLGMFIKNGQHSFVELVLWNELSHKFFLWYILESTTKQMGHALLTPWHGLGKMPACTWERVLKNNLTLLVDKTLGMFINNEQPSLIEPIL